MLLYLNVAISKPAYGTVSHITKLYIATILGECMALWGDPNELSIQHCVYIFMQYVAR